MFGLDTVCSYGWHITTNGVVPFPVADIVCRGPTFDGDDMRAIPVATEWPDAAVVRAGGRWLFLPVAAGIVLYGLQGVPQFLAGRWSGSAVAPPYWTDPWWIGGNAVYVAILMLALVTRRSRIRAGWSLFVALRAALVFICIGSVGAAVQYSYGHAGIAFFYTLVVSFAVHWTFWIAMALGLACLSVVARQGTIQERKDKAVKGSPGQQAG